MTCQRRTILAELRKIPCHPTADALYQRVRRRLPHISLGTVYRNLELLSRQGELMVIDQAGGQRHYDGNPKPHFHARCERCGCVADVKSVEPEALLSSVTDAAGFKLSGVRLEFVGLCDKCRS